MLKVHSAIFVLVFSFGILLFTDGYSQKKLTVGFLDKSTAFPIYVTQVNDNNLKIEIERPNNNKIYAVKWDMQVLKNKLTKSELISTGTFIVMPGTGVLTINKSYNNLTILKIINTNAKPNIVSFLKPTINFSMENIEFSELEDSRVALSISNMHHISIDWKIDNQSAGNDQSLILNPSNRPLQPGNHTIKATVYFMGEPIYTKQESFKVTSLPVPEITSLTSFPLDEGRSFTLRALPKVNRELIKGIRWYRNGQLMPTDQRFDLTQRVSDRNDEYYYELILPRDRRKTSRIFTTQTIPAPLPAVATLSTSVVRLKKGESDTIIVSLDESCNTCNPTYIEWTPSTVVRKRSQYGDTVIIKPTEKGDITMVPIRKTNGIIKRGPEQKIRVLVDIPSRLPDAISGVQHFWTSCNKLKETNLTLRGASLGSLSKSWNIYETSETGKKFIKKTNGNSFSLSVPVKTTEYMVSPDKESDLQFRFSLKVTDVPQWPKEMIRSNSPLCRGDKMMVWMNDSLPMQSIRYTWKYQLQSGKYISLQELPSASYIPYESGKVILDIRHECGMTKTYTKDIFVEAPPQLLGDIFKQYIYKGKSRQILSITSEPGVTYKWYADDDKKELLDTGSSVTVKDKKIQRVYLYATKNCGEHFISTEFLTWTKDKFDFFNAGIILNRFDNMRTAQIAIGTELLYFRLKLSTNTFTSTSYESNEDKVTNYPANTGTYYRFTDRSERIRNAFTLGVMFPKKWSNFKFYTGIGYGMNTVLWNVNIYSYATHQQLNNEWVKNTALSSPGVELETGIYFRIAGSINGMAGFNIISGKNGQYRDALVGIGYTFSKRR